MPSRRDQSTKAQLAVPLLEMLDVEPDDLRHHAQRPHPPALLEEVTRDQTHVRHVIHRIDGRFRLCIPAVLAPLAWDGTTRLAVTAESHRLAVRPADTGQPRVDGRGRLFLGPGAVRVALGKPGAVLASADLARQLLVLQPMSALDVLMGLT